MPDVIEGRVIAMVVTYNRRGPLVDCLEAIRAQTRPLDGVVVVDNASADGTAALLRERYGGVHVVSLAVNAGSSGGIYAGLEAALGLGADWIWTLDDDSVARPDALEQLLRAPDRDPSLPHPTLLASRVESSDGRAHPINLPILRRRDVDAMVRASEVGLIPLRANTFLGQLTARSAFERHGLPLRHFHFQTEDIEHTARVLRSEPGYLVPDSVVVHLSRAPAHAWDDVAPERFYYHLRNVIYMLRGDSWEVWEKPTWGWLMVTTTARFLRDQHFRPRSLATVARAVRDGLGRLEVA